MVTYPKNWEENSLDYIVAFKNGQAHENDISTNGKYIVVNSKFISTNGAIKKLSDRRNQPANLNSLGLTDIQRAARYFLLIKVSFGSDKKSFGTNKKNLANSRILTGNKQKIKGSSY